MYAVMLIFLLSAMVSAVIEPFLFLIESGTRDITLKVTKTRCSLDLNFSLSELEVTTLGVKTKLMYSKWQGLEFITGDETLKTEYGTAIDAGGTNFKKAAEGFLNLLRYTQAGFRIMPDTNCVLNLDMFENKVSELAFLQKKFDQILASWTIPSITGERKLTLDMIVNSYNELGSQWAYHSSKWNNILEKLSSGLIPDEIVANIEMLACVSGTNYEQLDIVKVTSGMRNYMAELELVLPTSVIKIRTYHYVNYRGAQLAKPGPDSDWVSKQGNEQLFSLTCTGDLATLDAPMCGLEEVKTDCTAALLTKNPEASINSCYFTRSEASPPHARLPDDSILVHSYLFSIVEGSKVIYTEAPMIIYSYEKVILTLPDKEEFSYSPSLKISNAQIIQTKLSNLQIGMLAVRAQWHDFWKEFTIFKYADITLFILQALFGPLSIWALALAFRALRQLRKPKKVKDIKRRKKENERENRTLLKTIEL
jgi:hypothetical protein